MFFIEAIVPKDVMTKIVQWTSGLVVLLINLENDAES
jgi:hypothetical protein